MAGRRPLSGGSTEYAAMYVQYVQSQSCDVTCQAFKQKCGAFGFELPRHSVTRPYGSVLIARRITVCAILPLRNQSAWRCAYETLHFAGTDRSFLLVPFYLWLCFDDHRRLQTNAKNTEGAGREGRKIPRTDENGRGNEVRRCNMLVESKGLSGGFVPRTILPVHNGELGGACLLQPVNTAVTRVLAIVRRD